jgi:phage terminase large subunit-like protein
VLSFVEWINAPNRGYYTREYWSIEKNRMMGMGKLVLMPEQIAILDHGLEFNEETGKFKYETFLYSTIKKSGKTSLAAAVGAWYAEEVGPPGTEIFAIANDLEQIEGRVMRDIKFHFQMRIEHGESIPDTVKGGEIKLTDKNTKITMYRIDLPSGTFIQALAQSYKTVAGSRHALTLWDELWGVTSELSRRVWDEMTPIPTIPHSLRFIATYAGFENESDLLWDLYLQGVGKAEHEQGRGTPITELEPLPVYENNRLITYWDHEPRLPWQTDEYYEEQMGSLRPAAFLRLHMNQWVTSHEAFIPIEWFDEAARLYEGPVTIWTDHPMRYFPIYVAVDAGIKRDSTALVGVGYDGQRGKVGLAFHYIWTPSKGNQVDLDLTVEAKLRELNTKFNIVSVVYDPTHLLQTMLRLKQLGMPTREFPQNVNLMTSASQLLYDLFKNKHFEAYQDDELRRHIQMAVAETNSRGFRIVKNKVSRRHFIDGAIATAMASYEAVNSGGVDISQAVVIESPYSDASAWNVGQAEQLLPFPLQTEN